MPLKSDGDVFRGLGYVTVYAAYVEESVDVLLQHLNAFDEKTERSPISQKLKLALENETLHSPVLKKLAETLDWARGLFVQRNELVHGRIYAVPGQEDDLLTPGRSNLPTRPITAEELYGLANDLFECQRLIAYESVKHRIDRAQSSGQA